MKTTVVFLVLLFFLQPALRAQQAKDRDRYSESQLFGEASGPGIGLSLNYEKLFWRGKDAMGFCVGAGLCPFIDAVAITAPLGLSYVHGSKHAFDLGLGSAPFFFRGEFSSDSEWDLYFLAGYRQRMLEGNADGRLFFSPFLTKQGSTLASNLDIKGRFVPYGGISLGILLGKKAKRVKSPSTDQI